MCIHKQVSDKCAAAKYGLGLVCREGKRLGNAAIITNLYRLFIKIKLLEKN